MYPVVCNLKIVHTRRFAAPLEIARAPYRALIDA